MDEFEEIVKSEPMQKWKEGYDIGCKRTLEANAEVIAIGRAILDVLDKRYARQEDDY